MIKLSDAVRTYFFLARFLHCVIRHSIAIIVVCASSFFQTPSSPLSGPTLLAASAIAQELYTHFALMLDAIAQCDAFYSDV